MGGEDVTRRLGRDVLAGAGGGASRLCEPGDFDADTYARGVDALSPAMGGAGELKEVCARVAPSRAAFAAGGGDAGAQGNGAPSGADAGAETFTLPDGRTVRCATRAHPRIRAPAHPRIRASARAARVRAAARLTLPPIPPPPDAHPSRSPLPTLARRSSPSASPCA